MTKTADPKYSQVPLTPSSEQPSSNSLQTKHAGERVGKGSPPTLLLGCKLQPLWRRVRRFPGKPDRTIHGPAIPLPGMYLENSFKKIHATLRTQQHHSHGSNLSVHETQRFSHRLK